VSLCDRDGIEFARGLTNYSSADAERIRGLATEQILRSIGKLPYVELIHRDNLAVVA
jgi:glutamate 5-kinase